ncbi:hypothetical protein CANCADRAFT_3017 [Tortispora caseinolytica NRRL Y-17796]|uniref:Uncharacterized protein n=1 Tax=Tortispora caseinolytica NRRL Y-17796 TaxID=767744 RepID=A0A1E4THT0_9ASCO|nr:hypothetical protein CANCADRAFT_3017 [Tortispora caseinolytica NRRL Y-17796]
MMNQYGFKAYGPRSRKGLPVSNLGKYCLTAGYHVSLRSSSSDATSMLLRTYSISSCASSGEYSTGTEYVGKGKSVCDDATYKSVDVRAPASSVLCVDNTDITLGKENGALYSDSLLEYYLETPYIELNPTEAVAAATSASKGDTRTTNVVGQSVEQSKADISNYVTPTVYSAGVDLTKIALSDDMRTALSHEPPGKGNKALDECIFRKRAILCCNVSLRCCSWSNAGQTEEEPLVSEPSLANGPRTRSSKVNGKAIVLYDSIKHNP